MNVRNDICDDEFVSFLNSLGVETYKKSFEWMLNDPEFGGVLRWLYNNLDHNNALTDHEEYRYIELEKKGALLSQEELELCVHSIQEQHPDICLPGDKESKEDVKMLINMHKQQISVLEKQEAVVKDLIKQNEKIKDHLNLELTQLNSAHRQCKEDEATAAEECTALVEELETITDGVIDVIAENLDLYASCRADKETAMRYLTFNPLESYRQSQALFRSHFELYLSKVLAERQNAITDEDMRAALDDAGDLEERLSEAAFGYIKTKAELSGEQAKLALVTNYNNVHPSQISSCLIEARSALELLDQEENILEQQVENAVKDLVDSRTNLAVCTAAVAALNVRQQIQNSLTYLVEVWQRAHSLDRLLYYLLRHELSTLEEFLQFASELRLYVVSEETAVSTRIESMNEIIAEHATCSLKLQSSNPLIAVLCAIFEAPVSDPVVLVKVYNDLQAQLKELTQNVQDGFKKKEDGLVQLKSSTKCLQDYIWSGCTKQANCWDRTVASLTHSLKQQMNNVDKRVLEATGLFTSVKNGDKKNLRKLWQWFLADPARLLAAMKSYRN